MSQEQTASREKVSLTVPLPAPEAQPGDTGYVPPSDAVPLPSKGQVYPPESPLSGAESVEIRPMTAKEEDILTSRALLKSGKAIDALLRSCVANKLVAPDQMLVGDRNAVLIAIRITGYGPEYIIDVECPACGEKKSKHTFDLSSLPIRPLGQAPDAPLMNCFTKKLPSGKVARFRLLTGADERELSTTLERAKKAGAEATVTTTILHQLVSLDGEENRDKLAKMVRGMPARDSRVLRRHIDDVTPGVDMTQTFACPSCSQDTEVDVPLGTEFFWPGN